MILWDYKMCLFYFVCIYKGHFSGKMKEPGTLGNKSPCAQCSHSQRNFCYKEQQPRSVLKLIVGDTDSMSLSVGDELRKMPQ